LAAFSPVAFAQNWGNNPGSSNGDQGYTNSGENYSNNGSEHGLWRESRELRDRLNSEQQNGTDVSEPQHQFDEGMRDLHAGDNTAAQRHFDRAENELGMNENGENGQTSAENYNSNDENNNDQMSENDLRQKASRIRDRINDEEQNGTDVQSAKHELHLGMRALDAGDMSKARYHLDQARNDLGNDQNYGSNTSSESSSHWNNHTDNGNW
jgi:hypothetical protein